MANTPRIGYGFDPRRLFLADLDGSGGSDLVYVDHDQVDFWFNQSGNGWSTRQTIDGTPDVTDLTALQFIDFYGTGTTTLLWSYDYGQQPGGGNYKILDFCGGQKPNLLAQMDNNMGATTRVLYAPSTKFYLEDKANGTPWISSLPFPVQVVEKTEVIDHISRTKLVTTYKYHHGYYDGREREFRGFGRVDQFDTEFFDDFTDSSLHGDGAGFDNTQGGFHVPPIETRTWFHTGIYFDQNRYLDHRELTEQFRSEYYQGDPRAFVLDEHFFERPDGSEGPGDMPHEAYRALRGAVLRSEVYGRDQSVNSDHPYTVSENRYAVKALQPKNGNNHAVYLTTPKESLNYHYERNPADPRIGQSLTLGIDDFGNVTDSVAIGYPRRVVPEDLPEQGELKVVYTHSDFINQYSSPTDMAAGFYYAGIPGQTRAYEITGIHWQSGDSQLTEQHFEEIMDTSVEVDTDSFRPYQWQRSQTDTGVHRRIIEWTRTYFRADADPELIDPVGNLDHRLALGEIESLALSYETYQAVFTNSFLQQIYDGRTTGIDLAGEGGYHPYANHTAAEGIGSIEEYRWIHSGRQRFDPDQFFQADRAQDPFGNITTSELDAYALLMETATDALPAPRTNVVSAKNDYRVLQPYEVTDPNGNRSQAAFDALGLVVGTATMGEDAQGNPVGDSLDDFVADLAEETRDGHIADPLNRDAALDTDPHNILKNATTRVVYDLHRFSQTGQPNVVYTLARETHVSDEQGVPSKIQHTFTYSDGFGRESQTKVRAEPDRIDPTKPRWVGTGTTVYNNKGKTVQQFEPFFSDDHQHGIEQHGVSPTLFYDPLERVVCTVHPNHTYDKVVFDPWQQTTWDSNDTLLLDPRTDPDVIQYVNEYFLDYDRDYQERHGEPPKTWYQEHLLSTDTAKQEAARKTEPHANTPTVAHLDTLGRPILTVADNGVDDQGNEQKYPTRIKLDIEGNQREVIDAKGRVVMRYDYYMAGPEESEEEEEDTAKNPLHQTSMDAGERWTLTNVAGNPIRAWDSRGHVMRTSYDELQRPLDLFVTQGDSTEVLAERAVYGEGQPNAEALNLKGQLSRQYDCAGVVTSEAYDFKGNPLRSTRQLLQNYKEQVDWSLSPELESETFTSRILYDALNRPLTLTQPDGSVIRPGYNEANLLERITANLRAADEATPFVTNIDYDAKGQRELIEYGNGVRTEYHYDPLTFRLTQLKTIRASDGNVLQDLNYFYDPVGNITGIRDDAQQTVFFNKAVVSPNTRYQYDALYRLIRAEGREHAGQNADTQRDHTDLPRMNLPHANDANALRRYAQEYEYDAVGNILKMIHQATNGPWTRRYRYATDSNRLLSNSLPGDDPDGPYSAGYEYDEHGSMTRMPHLNAIQWDFEDRMHQVDLVGGGTAYYVYDAAGQRVRKVHEHNRTTVEERIYLGDYEIYRKRNSSGLKLERETLHIMDDQQRIALVETKTMDAAEPNLVPSSIIRYQLGNHLGSAALELDGSDRAALISYEEYHPYGTTSYHAMRSGVEVSLKRYRFTGKERDEESGLYYHGARYYAAWLARWVSADPAGLVDSLDLYTYAQNNPIFFSDPTGAQSEEEPPLVGHETVYVTGRAPGEIETIGDQSFTQSLGKHFWSPNRNSPFQEVTAWQFVNRQLRARIKAGLPVRTIGAAFNITQTRSGRSRSFAEGMLGALPGWFVGEAGDLLESAFVGTVEAVFGGSHANAPESRESITYPRESYLDQVKNIVVAVGGGKLIQKGFKGKKGQPKKPPSTRITDSKTVIREHDAYLAVVSKEGEVLAKRHTASMLSHKEFVTRSIGTLPEGARAVTVGKIEGKLVVINSMGVHKNQNIAPKWVHDAIEKVFE